jgi:hypothetical protein
MKTKIILILAIGLTGGLLLAQYDAGSQEKPSAAKPDFDITASYIEACSCDMFCPCYFNTRSTHHHEGEYCRANLVFRTDKGYYKDTKLDGAKVWLTTDLGSDWSTGKDSWVVIHYDPGVTPAQKAAFNDILAQLYPMKWEHADVDTAAFMWKVDAKTGEAHAKMDNGKGEVILERVKGDDPAHEVVVHNLKYWLAQSNNGFRMWKSKHEAFAGHGHDFSYDGTNGFLITIHFSGQAKAAAAD